MADDGPVDLDAMGPAATGDGAAGPDLADLDLIGPNSRWKGATVRVIPYDRDRKQDSDRAFISFVLLGMLLLIIVLGFVLSLWALSPTDSIENNLKTVIGFLNIVFGPIVTLVGSATGFYFGSRSNGGKGG